MDLRLGCRAVAAFLSALIGGASILAIDSANAADDEPIPVDTISVSATRNPIKAFEYPGMVSVIGRDRMLSQQPSTPDDVLRFVPNVEFVGGPRRTGETPSIRGFSGADVIVTVDGARQNIETGHNGRFFLDPSLLSAVEVLRGPASSLYGSGGTGGLIAFRTVRAEDLLAPGETAGLSIGGGYSTANRERLGIVSLYAQPSDGLDLVGSVTKRDSGSIELGDGSKLDQTDDDILAGLAKLGYAFADHHRVEASYMRFGNEAEEPNNGQGVGGDDIVEKDIATNTWRLAYNYSNPTDNLIDLDALVYYTDFQVDETRLDNLGLGPLGERLTRDVDTVGFRLDNRSRAMLGNDVGVTFTYGAEAYRDTQDGSSSGGSRDGVPNAEAEFAGIFAQAELRVTEPFNALPGDFLIIPGVRFDRFTSSSAVSTEIDDDEVSPRIGVSYLPTEWAILFASYAHAFRAPTINEAYLDGVHFEIPIGPGITNRFVANPDLKPQRTETLEFGFGFDFKDIATRGDRLQFKASHFETDGEDFIDLQVIQPEPFIDCNPFIPGNCDGTTRAINVADAELSGNEIEAFYDSRHLSIALGVSTLDGRDKQTGEYLGVLTPPQATVDVAYKLLDWDSLVGWRTLGALSFDDTNDPSEEREGYAVHDLYFAWIPQNRALAGLRVDLGIDNIFDKAYARVFTDALEPGRDFKGRVSYAVNF
ncbi:MAG: TonB-dependent receptor [Alphaproteobacteria bacterium]